MLGPTLFLIYIIAIDTAVDLTGSILVRFSGEKSAMVTESEEDRRIIQQGLLVDERVSRLADGIDTGNPSW